MARANLTHKPGEKAPEGGTYYCYVCSLRSIESSCELKAGELFLACPQCLERKVAEWDMTWKAAELRPGSGRREKRAPVQWPGSLERDA